MLKLRELNQLSLDQIILFVILAALLPITVLSIVQAISTRDLSRQLIEQKLVSSTIATSALQRDPFVTARHAISEYKLNSDVKGMSAECSSTLRQLLKTHNAVINFMRLDAGGQVRCSAQPITAAVSYANDEWWRDARRSKTFSITGPIFGKITRRNVFLGIQPIYDGAGQFDGVLAAAIDISWLEGALKQQALSENALVAIANRTGRTLLSSGGYRLNKVDLEASARGAVSRTADDGTQWLYASASLLPDQLYVVYAELQNPLMSPVQSQLRTNVILPLLAIILTSLAVWVALQHYVLKWLEELAKLAAQFAGGNFVHQQSQFSKAPRELAALGSSLSAMAIAIERRDEDLTISAKHNHAMAREVNHRIKNNLQMVVSLLELQTMQIKDTASKTALDQTRVRIAAIALLNRLLYDMSEISEQGVVDLDVLFAELCVQLGKNFLKHRLDLRCSSTAGIVPVNLAMPLALFAVEAVVMSYRNSFDDRPDHHISLEVSGSDRSGQVLVKNTGEVRAGETIDEMSVQLMNAYASQVNGVVSTLSDPAYPNITLMTYQWEPSINIDEQ